MDDQTNFIRGLFERVSAAGFERTKDFHSAIPQFEFIVYSQKCCFCISAKNLLANHRLSFLAELRRLKRRRNSGLGHQWKQEKHKVINPCFKCSKSEQKILSREIYWLSSLRAYTRRMHWWTFRFGSPNLRISKCHCDLIYFRGCWHFDLIFFIVFLGFAVCKLKMKYSSCLSDEFHHGMKFIFRQ